MQVRLEGDMENLSKVFKGLNQPRILDVGTGRGNFVDRIIRVTDNFSSIIGIDYNEKAIEVAKESFEDERIEFLVKDLREFQQSDERFDIVCLSNSLHHLETIEPLLEIMESVLTDDGMLIINEMYKDNQNEKQMTHVLMHHLNAEINRLTGIVHNETFERQGIIDILNDKYIIVKSFDIEDELYEYTSDDIQEMKDTFANVLKPIVDHSDYHLYKEKVNTMYDRLDTVGFELASQMICVCKKK